MYTRLTLILIIVFAYNLLPAQNTTYIGATEAETIPGDYSYYGMKHAINNDKEQLISGGFSGMMLINNDSIVSGSIRSSFLGLKDSLGIWKWAKKINGNGYNQVNASLALDDGWLVAGVFLDTIYAGEIELISNLKQSVFLLHIDNSGEFIWGKKFELSPLGGKQFLANANDDNIYFASEFKGEFEYGDTVFNSNNKHLAIIMQLSQQGDTEKAFMINSKKPVKLSALQSNAEHGLFLAGIIKDSTDIAGEIIANPGKDDYFVAYLNSNLEAQWVKYSEGTGMKSLSDANVHNDGIVIIGQYKGELSIEQQAFEVKPGTNIYVVKYDTLGNLLWKNNIEGHSHKKAINVISGDQNELYLFGSYRGKIEFLDNEYETQDFEYGLFIARYSHEGQQQWISFADNIEDINSNIIKSKKPGHISFLGFSKAQQQALFGSDLDSLSHGGLIMELVDCDYAAKPDIPTDTVFCGQGFLLGNDDSVTYIWDDSYQGHSYEVFSTGTVYVEATDSYGCTTKDSVFVEVLPEFVIEIAGNNMICPNGGSTLLMVEQGAEITWNTGESGQSIFATESGEYIAEAVNHAGCYADASITVSAYDLVPPALDNYYLIDTTQILELFPGDYYSYSWTGGSQDDTFVVDGSFYEEGSYAFLLEVTDYNECVQQHDFIVDIYDVTGSSSNASNNNEANLFNNEAVIEGCDFLLYPNPGKEPFFISLDENTSVQFDSKYSIYEVNLWNMQGELMFKEKQENKNFPWTIKPINNLNPGAYFVSLRVDGQLCNIKKIIVLQ